MKASAYHINLLMKLCLGEQPVNIISPKEQYTIKYENSFPYVVEVLAYQLNKTITIKL